MKNTKGLYIHIPFCIKKCKYCDFVSYSGMDQTFEAYIDKLLKEAYQFKNENIDTVFIGGGTPTCLSEKLLEKLLTGINNTFNFSDNLEFSIEANPKTLNEQKLKVLKDNSVNRISIGVQSFCDEELLNIGRIHNGESAYNTVCMVKESGFSNINLDLMLSLPNQTEKSLINTLEKVVSLNPQHLSCYSLILEENTPLFYEYNSGKFKYPDDDFDRHLYHLTVDFLKEHGYSRYEISNFSKPGFLCRHNLKYWNGEEYIGLGVAAHSYLNSKRCENTSDLSEYLTDDSPKIHEESLTINDKISEYIITRLRLVDGILKKEFKVRFSKDIYELYNDEIKKLISLNLLFDDGESIFLTDYGFDVSNSVMCEFVWYCINWVLKQLILWTNCKNGRKKTKNSWLFSVIVVFYIC